jgi:multidrug efflux system outer membrane protein
MSERYAQIVAVYQAMGGGWVDLANAATPQPVGMATTAAK